MIQNTEVTQITQANLCTRGTLLLFAGLNAGFISPAINAITNNAISASPISVYTCGDTVNFDPDVSGDRIVTNQRQWASTSEHNSFVSQARSDFGMKSWHYNRFTSSSDFNAILNALWILKNAPSGLDSDLQQANPLYSAYQYVKRRYNSLRPVCTFSKLTVGPLSISVDCDTGENDACNVPSLHASIEGIETRNNIEFFRNSLFKSTVISRAGLLVHEARHSDQGYEVAVDPKKSHPGWPDGPYARQVKWLAWFAATGNPIFGEEMRFQAARSANNLARDHNFPIPTVRAVTRGSGLELIHIKDGLPVVDYTYRLGTYPRAIVYQNSSFSGRRAEYTTLGRQTNQPVGNDAISSAWVRKGHCLVLTEDSNLRGVRRTYEPGLHSGFGWFNDDATSVAVYSKNRLPCSRFETGTLTQSDVSQSQTYRFKITNYWKRDKSLHLEQPNISAGSVQPGWLSARWIFEPVGNDAVRIRNLWRTDHYLNHERGYMEAGPTNISSQAAHWVLEPVRVGIDDGLQGKVYRIRNLLRLQGNDRYLTFIGYLAIRPIEQTALDSLWIIESI
ncbi:MAG: hypothetical protein KTR25_04440 [Myxococcales bacterium]|nr:hypothetical protein [Myxococcales bacterium]